MNLMLDNKVFLVAGASKGMGFCIAKRLLNEGAKVSIISSKSDNIERAQNQLAAGDDCLASVCDVTDPSAINDWVNKTQQYFGRIDGLVVNAGGPKPGVFDDFDDGAWLDAFKGSSILNITSV